jgi:hypothetical protein
MGGLVIANLSIHRVVPDEEILAAGEGCFWMDADETVCSAHSLVELAAAGIDTSACLREPPDDDLEALT